MHQQDHGIQVISDKSQILEYLELAQPNLKLESSSLIKGRLVFAMREVEIGYELLDPSIHYDDPRIIQDEYFISIEWNIINKPYPVVKEDGNRICDSFKWLSKKVAWISHLRDLHLYEEDNSLCLCTNSEYEIRYPEGIKINELIEELIIPFFYYQSYLQRNLKEPYSGRGHGILGILEYLEESRQIPQLDKITFEILQREYPQTLNSIRVKKPSSSRMCICGSNRKGKKCHWSATRGAKLLYEYIQKSKLL